MKDRKEEQGPAYSTEDVKELLEYEKNPFDKKHKKASDIMRIFFEENVPLLPVISRRNTLLGILTKPALTAAMSDIDNFDSVKIDHFITKIAAHMDFEQLVPLIGSTKEFTIINIFGEKTGSWSRIDLLEAVDTTRMQKSAHTEESLQQKNEQAIEWMIYMILEHIPRALYAMNLAGKTIFYNGLFEEIVLAATGKEEVDVTELEEVLGDSLQNDFFETENSDEYLFYNKSLDLYYEKMPMKNEGELVGYLVYCSNRAKEVKQGDAHGSETLKERLDTFERKILVESLHASSYNIADAASSLGISKHALQNKVKKYDIELKKQ